MNIILLGDQRHEVHNCITCGVIFTIPEALIEQHRKKGGFHSCCNGHQQGWDKSVSEEEKVRRERDRLRQQMAEKDDALAAKDREIISAKGQITKLRKRASAGTCPCCSRSFENMARHMKTKHPTFKAEAEKPALRVVA